MNRRGFVGSLLASVGGLLYSDRPPVAPEELSPMSPKIGKLTIEPGDKLAVFVDQPLRPEMVETIRQSVRQWAGDVPVIICPAGIELAVVKQVPAKQGM